MAKLHFSLPGKSTRSAFYFQVFIRHKDSALHGLYLHVHLRCAHAYVFTCTGTYSVQTTTSPHICPVDGVVHRNIGFRLFVHHFRLAFWSIKSFETSECESKIVGRSPCYVFTYQDLSVALRPLQLQPHSSVAPQLERWTRLQNQRPTWMFMPLCHDNNDAKYIDAYHQWL